MDLVYAFVHFSLLVIQIFVLALNANNVITQV